MKTELTVHCVLYDSPHIPFKITSTQMKPNSIFMYSPKGHPVTNCIYRLMTVKEGETRQILWDFHACMNLV